MDYKGENKIRSRYDLAQNSITKTTAGTYYKDIFTIPIQKFQYQESFLEYYLTKKDIERPDLFIGRAYKKVELDDIIMWINNIGLIYDKDSGDAIKLPSIRDIEEFYYTYRL